MEKYPDYEMDITFAVVDIDIIKMGYDILDEMIPNTDPITLSDFEEELSLWSDEKISREIDRIAKWGSSFDVCIARQAKQEGSEGVLLREAGNMGRT